MDNKNEYKFSTGELGDLMEYRGNEAVEYFKKTYNNIDDFCSKLETSKTEGLPTYEEVERRRKLFGANVFLKQNFEKTGYGVNAIRNGLTVNLSVKDLVVGDVCVTTAEEYVQADGILIQGSDNLSLDESMLTGETGLIKKSVSCDPILLSGSKVVYGSGQILIIAVGKNSQVGLSDKIVENEHKYKFSIHDLGDLMEYRGTEAVEYFKKTYNNIDDFCSKLETSKTEGLSDVRDIERRRKLFGANIFRDQDLEKTGYTVNAIRNGQSVSLPVMDLVVGDMCLIKVGQYVPADGIGITVSDDLAVDESMVTGESGLIQKTTDPIFLSGSKVVRGTGQIVIIGVGINSQIGIRF